MGRRKRHFKIRLFDEKNGISKAAMAIVAVIYVMMMILLGLQIYRTLYL